MLRMSVIRIMDLGSGDPSLDSRTHAEFSEDYSKNTDVGERFGKDVCTTSEFF